jgi:hypothetical protein
MPQSQEDKFSKIYAKHNPPAIAKFKQNKAKKKRTISLRHERQPPEKQANISFLTPVDKRVCN